MLDAVKSMVYSTVAEYFGCSCLLHTSIGTVADHIQYICFLGLLTSATDGSWPRAVSQSVNVYCGPLVIGRGGERFKWRNG